MALTYVRNLLLVIGIIIIFTVCIKGKKLCGPELADTLKSICNNSYNGFNRFTAPLQSNNAQIEGHSVYEYQSMPFVSKLIGGVLFPRVRRKRRGVSDECCKKACTYRELANYCG